MTNRRCSTSTQRGFWADGTVEGFSGCNDFSGGYSVNGDAIAIGPLMSTMKSCGVEFEASLPSSGSRHASFAALPRFRPRSGFDGRVL